MTEHPTGTRDQILAAALRLFAHKSYAQTGMDEIAREVGISKPAIYHYFESKEKLFVTLIEQAHAVQDRLLAEIAALGLPLSRLIEEVFRRGTEFLRENPEWSLLILQVQSFPGATLSCLDFHAHHADELADLVRVLEGATGDLRLRPGMTMTMLAEYVHWVFFAFWTRSVFLGEMPDDDLSPRRLADVILNGAFEKG
jgi:AcrR family transcriptional regulator